MEHKLQSSGFAGTTLITDVVWGSISGCVAVVKVGELVEGRAPDGLVWIG